MHGEGQWGQSGEPPCLWCDATCPTPPPLLFPPACANKGIGLDIVRQLARRSNTRTVLAARSEERGRAALEAVQAEAGPGSSVVFHQLDITDPASVSRFADWARGQLQEIDVLINNAGFAYKGNVFGAEEAATTIGVNFRGEQCNAMQ